VVVVAGLVLGEFVVVLLLAVEELAKITAGLGAGEGLGELVVVLLLAVEELA